MKTSFDPRRLDVAAFCRAEGQIEGDAPLSAFKRLAEGAEAESGSRAVNWRVQGESPLAPGGARLVRLHVVADADVDLTCQRCLEPMVASLQVDRWFRFVADEATAARLDETSDDDVLVMDRAFDLLSLIEDELLLEWPSVPRHPDCRPPNPNDRPLPSPEIDEKPPVPGSFAKLARLRSGNAG